MFEIIYRRLSPSKIFINKIDLEINWHEGKIKIQKDLELYFDIWTSPKIIILTPKDVEIVKLQFPNRILE